MNQACNLTQYLSFKTALCLLYNLLFTVMTLALIWWHCLNLHPNYLCHEIHIILTDQLIVNHVNLQGCVSSLLYCVTGSQTAAIQGRLMIQSYHRVHQGGECMVAEMVQSMVTGDGCSWSHWWQRENRKLKIRVGPGYNPQLSTPKPAPTS